MLIQTSLVIDRKRVAKLADGSSRCSFIRAVVDIRPTVLLVLSTASVDMKQPFGAKPARSFLLLMPWIAASHGIEGAVSATTNSPSTITRNVNFELIQALLDHCPSTSKCITRTRGRRADMRGLPMASRISQRSEKTQTER